MVFWSSGSRALSSSLWSQSEDKERRLKSGSGNRTTVAFLTGRPAPPSQEDKVESFCVCCACERCMDFWLSTSLKCFSTWKIKQSKSAINVHKEIRLQQAASSMVQPSSCTWTKRCMKSNHACTRSGESVAAPLLHPQTVDTHSDVIGRRGPNPPAVLRACLKG